MISTQDLSTLRNFFGSQFHEDWVDEADDPDVIVKWYIESSRLSRQELKGMGQAILDYMQGMDDAELDERLFTELACYYYPQGEGIPAREWLRRVASMLMENDKPG